MSVSTVNCQLSAPCVQLWCFLVDHSMADWLAVCVSTFKVLYPPSDIADAHAAITNT